MVLLFRIGEASNGQFYLDFALSQPRKGQDNTPVVTADCNVAGMVLLGLDGSRQLEGPWKPGSFDAYFSGARLEGHSVSKRPFSSCTPPRSQP